MHSQYAQNEGYQNMIYVSLEGSLNPRWH